MAFTIATGQYQGGNVQSGERFLYTTADTAATVAGAGYFSPAARGLDVGQIIEVVSDTGGTPLLKSYVITAVTKPDLSNGVAGAVTIALQTVT